MPTQIVSFDVWDPFSPRHKTKYPVSQQLTHIRPLQKNKKKQLTNQVASLILSQNSNIKGKFVKAETRIGKV